MARSVFSRLRHAAGSRRCHAIIALTEQPARSQLKYILKCPTQPHPPLMQPQHRSAHAAATGRTAPASAPAAAPAPHSAVDSAPASLAASASSAATSIDGTNIAMPSAHPHPLLPAWNAHSLMEWRCGDLRARFLHGSDSNSAAASAG